MCVAAVYFCIFCISFSLKHLDAPAFEHTEIDELNEAEEIAILNAKNLVSIAKTNKIVIQFCCCKINNQFIYESFIY